MYGPCTPLSCVFFVSISKNLLYILLIAIAGILCCRIAILTPYNVHPDEFSHVDAFEYYETNWWPPDLGSDKLIYSRYGTSHVYTGELVYFIYGKIGHVLNLIIRTNHIKHLIYRFINIFLFVSTLSVLFFAPCRIINTAPIAIVFLCIPQVSYIYSYANYDGWAVSSTVFLFVLALVMAEKSVTPWSWSKIGLLGLLTGFIFGSRDPDILGLIIPYSILGIQIIRNSTNSGVAMKYVARLIIALLIAFCIASPLKLIFPYSQDNYGVAYQQMLEDKAQKPFKPSTRSHPTFYLSKKGETYRHLLLERKWIVLSYMSFYGCYGYLSTWNPVYVYLITGIALFLAFTLTTYTCITRWKAFGDLQKSILALSPLLFLINIGASIWYSMHIDFQAQGRYLFCTLIPFCILLVGTFNVASQKIKDVMIGIFIILYLFSTTSLFFIAPRTRLPF